MARFQSKLVAFPVSVNILGLDNHVSLDKHTSLLQNP